MKLLIDIGHPAHVHLFRHLASSLVEKGWEVLFSVRVKGENVALLKAYGLLFQVYGASEKGIFSKVFTLPQKNIELYRIFKDYKPTISISHSSFYLSQVSWLCNVPNITLEDTGNMEQVLLYLPFTDIILTPADYHRNHGRKQIRYNGFHETAYIHPDFYGPESDDKKIIPDIILIRLVDWTASHDVGHKGISATLISAIIKAIDDKSKIKILSEKPLPKHLQQFELNIPPDQLYEFLSNVVLYIGEGATLASECALMGIPAIYVNSRSAGVIKAQADAGLLYHFTSGDGVLEKAVELLSDKVSYKSHQTKAAKFLENKINLSRFLVWFIENYPESKRIMKEKPDETQSQFM